MNVRKLLMLSDDALAMAAAMEAVLPLASAFAPLRSKYIVTQVTCPVDDRFFVEDASLTEEGL